MMMMMMMMMMQDGASGLASGGPSSCMLIESGGAIQQLRLIGIVIGVGIAKWSLFEKKGLRALCSISCVKASSRSTSTDLTKTPRAIWTENGRPFWRVCADNMKQVISGATDKAMLILLSTWGVLNGNSLAMFYAVTVDYTAESGYDECDEYVLSAIFDTMFGPLMAIRILLNVQYLAAHGGCCGCAGTNVLTCDYATGETRMKCVEMWSLQAACWWTCVVTSRVIALGALVLLYKETAAPRSLLEGINFFFSPLPTGVKQQIVIIWFPIVLDSVQYIVQEMFLRTDGDKRNGTLDSTEDTSCTPAVGEDSQLLLSGDDEDNEDILLRVDGDSRAPLESFVVQRVVQTFYSACARLRPSR